MLKKSALDDSHLPMRDVLMLLAILASGVGVYLGLDRRVTRVETKLDVVLQQRAADDHPQHAILAHQGQDQ